VTSNSSAHARNHPSVAGVSCDGELQWLFELALIAEFHQTSQLEREIERFKEDIFDRLKPYSHPTKVNQLTAAAQHGPRFSSLNIQWYLGLVDSRP
jgi:hypothetical protein